MKLLERPAVHLAITALVGLIVYSNTLNVPFQWDEYYYVFDNPFARSLDYFLHPSKAQGHDVYVYFKSRYVGYLTFALNQRLHGMDVTGYHVVNLLIHILNALLVYLFVVLTFRTPFLEESRLREHSGHMAFLTGLFFIAHPIQTEAVTYVYQRFASLMATFYLSSLVCYIKWRLKRRTAVEHLAHPPGPEGGIYLYFLSLLFALLAVKTKENAFSLPIAVLLYDLTFFGGRRPLFKRSMFLVPYILIVLVIPLSIIETGKSLGEVIGEATKTQDMFSRHDYFLTQFPVMVTYLRLLMLPINQNLDYAYPVYNSFFNPKVFLSFLFLFSLLGLSIYLHLRSRSGEKALRLISFGILWFFLTLSVESSVIALSDVIFEHRVYLPSAGLFPALVTGVAILLHRAGVRSVRVLVCVGGVLLAVLAGAAYSRNNVWRSEVVFWEDVVKKSPGKARVHNNLGRAYFNVGHMERAIEQLQIAIKLQPDSAEAHGNLAHAYESVGLLEAAVQHYEIALKLNPEDHKSHNNLGAIYDSRGLSDKAIEHYRAALSLKPDFAKAHNNLAVAYGFRGLLPEAITHYESALRLEPEDPEVHNNLGAAYAAGGRLDEAVEHFKTALRLKPDLSGAHNNLSIAYKKMGMIEEAQRHRREFERLENK